MDANAPRFSQEIKALLERLAHQPLTLAQVRTKLPVRDKNQSGELAYGDRPRVPVPTGLAMTIKDRGDDVITEAHELSLKMTWVNIRRVSVESHLHKNFT